MRLMTTVGSCTSGINLTNLLKPFILIIVRHRAGENGIGPLAPQTGSSAASCEQQILTVADLKMKQVSYSPIGETQEPLTTPILPLSPLPRGMYGVINNIDTKIRNLSAIARLPSRLPERRPGKPSRSGCWRTVDSPPAACKTGEVAV